MLRASNHCMMHGLELPTAASRACYCTHLSSSAADQPKSSVSWAWRLRCEHCASTVWDLRRGWRQRCVQADGGGIAGASTCATAGQQTVLGPCVAAARHLQGCEACGPPLPMALCMVAPPVVAERRYTTACCKRLTQHLFPCSIVAHKFRLVAGRASVCAPACSCGQPGRRGRAGAAGTRWVPLRRWFGGPSAN